MWSKANDLVDSRQVLAAKAAGAEDATTLQTVAAQLRAMHAEVKLPLYKVESAPLAVACSRRPRRLTSWSSGPSPRQVLAWGPMSVNDICCYMPAWFGSLATLMCGLFAYEVPRARSFRWSSSWIEEWFT